MLSVLSEAGIDAQQLIVPHCTVKARRLEAVRIQQHHFHAFPAGLILDMEEKLFPKSSAAIGLVDKQERDLKSVHGAFSNYSCNDPSTILDMEREVHTHIHIWPVVFLQTLVDVYSHSFCELLTSSRSDMSALLVPFPGGLLDQPYMTIQDVRLVQLSYRRHLAKKTEAARSKMKRR